MTLLDVETFLPARRVVQVLPDPLSARVKERGLVYETTSSVKAAKIHSLGYHAVCELTEHDIPGAVLKEALESTTCIYLS